MHPFLRCGVTRRASAELRAVIGAQHLRQSTVRRELIQHPRDREATECARRHNRDGLGRGIVDDRQDLQSPAFGRPIEDEVGRPDFIAPRTEQGLAVADRTFFRRRRFTWSRASAYSRSTRL